MEDLSTNKAEGTIQAVTVSLTSAILGMKWVSRMLNMAEIRDQFSALNGTLRQLSRTKILTVL